MFHPVKALLFFSASCATIVAVLLGGCGKGSSGPKELVVGMELAYPPFEMTDMSGKPDGVSVALAKALGEHLGRPVRIRNIAFDGLIPSLKTGKIDLILSSMTRTEERARSIDFSEPYLRTGLCLLVGANSGIASIGDLDLPGKRVAVKLNTTGHTYARETLRQAEVRPLDQETSCVLEVVQGRADAFIYDQMSTYSHWRKNPDTTRAILRPFQEEAWAIGIRKGEEELLAAVNAFLAEFRASNGFEELGDRYLPEQKAAFREMGYPFYF